MPRPALRIVETPPKRRFTYRDDVYLACWHPHLDLAYLAKCDLHLRGFTHGQLRARVRRLKALGAWQDLKDIVESQTRLLAKLRGYQIED